MTYIVSLDLGRDHRVSDRAERVGDVHETRPDPGDFVGKLRPF